MYVIYVHDSAEAQTSRPALFPACRCMTIGATVFKEITWDWRRERTDRRKHKPMQNELSTTSSWGAKAPSPTDEIDEAGPLQPQRSRVASALNGRFGYWQLHGWTFYFPSQSMIYMNLPAESQNRKTPAPSEHKRSAGKHIDEWECLSQLIHDKGHMCVRT